MVKINFQNNITKCNADTFNTMQDNIETAIDTNTTNISTLDTKVNNNITYSTTETRVGTWTDGKPLYRIVYNFNATSTSPYQINIASLNIDTLVSINGAYKTGSYDRVPITVWYSATYNLATTVKINSTIDIAWVGWANLTGGTIVLEYTKTTD